MKARSFYTVLVAAGILGGCLLGYGIYMYGVNQGLSAAVKSQSLPSPTGSSWRDKLREFETGGYRSTTIAPAYSPAPVYNGPFIYKRGVNVCHLPTCQYAGGIAIFDRVVVSTRYEAQILGLIACPNCNP